MKPMGRVRFTDWRTNERIDGRTDGRMDDGWMDEKYLLKKSGTAYVWRVNMSTSNWKFNDEEYINL